MQIFDMDQGSGEWFAARAGIPTASEFHTILAKGKTAGSSSETRRKYLYRLAAEIITGEAGETYTNAHMERGKVMEDEARDFYAFTRDVEPERVGFVRNGRKGCSPDSFVGDRGALEVKTKLPPLLIEALFRDDFPPEHKAQCQGVLWVAEREWIDITVYWPKMPTLIRRAVRDEDYIANLSGEVDRFNDELDNIVERLRRLGEPASAKEAA
jgi:hypothetical protein